MEGKVRKGKGPYRREDEREGLIGGKERYPVGGEGIDSFGEN